jgi:fatty-acyl-CoA synthase
MSVLTREQALTSASRGPTPAKAWLRALEKTAPIAANPTRIFPTVMEEAAERYGDTPALLSRHESLTYRALGERSNRYARWALAHGVGKGDVVALLMPNRPEYLAIWLGIIRIGGIAALLNTNLTGPALAHCINAVAPRHVIIDAENIVACTSALSNLTSAPTIWSHGDHDHQFERIDLAVEQYAGESLPDEARPPLTTDDRALYIYTSGTTGLPKAAIVDHHRLMMWTHWFAGMMDTRPDDRMYNCLPMYHSIGGAVATGAVLVNGGSVVIEKKFSASRFWDDIVEYDCTLFQYIGELCRYLVNAPPHPREHQHRLRLCAGNGLRADVWAVFKDRFRIPQILEFYAATEGNVSLYNIEGVPGSIGRIPAFLAHRFPAALLRFDVEANAPVRDANGLCIPCAPNEVGEAIGKICQAASSSGGRFEGYIEAKDSEKKILRDVFEKGDAWFHTGDLMRRDERGFFYFVDRIGDTFRWKGENVSTSEVAETITDFAGITEANVYGVAVPGTDGRAGMAAIVADATLDLAAFHRHLTERLPPYARPLFVRITSAMDVTATFKQTKSALIKEGFDPSIVNDVIYFNDAEREVFVRLDQALFEKIQSGQVRLRQRLPVIPGPARHAVLE